MTKRTVSRNTNGINQHRIDSRSLPAATTATVASWRNKATGPLRGILANKANHASRRFGETNPPPPQSGAVAAAASPNGSLTVPYLAATMPRKLPKNITFLPRRPDHMAAEGL
jgi:hypothetical protein